MKDKTIIIGAGPAGLIAASELAKGGKKVIVLEKGRYGQIDSCGRTKLCGGGLIPLSRMFLGKIEAETHENRVFEARTKHCKAFVSLDYSPVTTIDRDLLAKELTERALSQGVEILFDTSVKDIDLNKKEIKIGDNRVIKYNVIVGADGPFSIVRKKLEQSGYIKNNNKWLLALEYSIPSQEIDRILTIDFDHRLFSGGYAWIFPHKNYTLIGACESILTRKQKKRPIVKDLTEWAKRENLPFDKKTLRSWVIPYDYQGYCFPDNVYLVGDAAGFTGGLLGEGMSGAILSGFDVAHLIMDDKYRPRNIQLVLKKKRLHELILNTGNRSPLLRTLLLDIAVMLAKYRLTREIPLTVFNLVDIR